MTAANAAKNVITVRLPEPHAAQSIFYYWSEWHPEAQCLIAPCGTKLGKSFGAAAWLAIEALTIPRLFCVWIAPTYRKAKIGFRYIRAMLPDCEFIKTVEGKLEIRLANGSVIHFMHGHDAEVTVEGEAIDRFVIDEASKTVPQVWHSLITTITQTNGKGIITGTPRGRNWYKTEFDKAGEGACYTWDGKALNLASSGQSKFWVRVTLPTAASPYVAEQNIKAAESLLPRHLFLQYYLAQFTSESTVFGDMASMYDLTLERAGRLLTWGQAEPRLIDTSGVKFWLHPDANTRTGTITHGVDLAKKQDWTVFYSVNQRGKLVGFARFRRVPYGTVAKRLRDYVVRYYSECENIVRYDATGVGESVGEHISEAFNDTSVDITINPVTFTNKLKASMVTRTMMAIQEGWHKAPRIDVIDNEFTGYEVTVTKHGNCSYAAADGQNDDVVSAAMLAIAHAYQNASAEQAEVTLAQAMGVHDGMDADILAAYADIVCNRTTDDDDEFFDDSNEDDIDFDEATA